MPRPMAPAPMMATLEKASVMESVSGVAAGDREARNGWNRSDRVRQISSRLCGLAVGLSADGCGPQDWGACGLVAHVASVPGERFNA